MLAESDAIAHVAAVMRRTHDFRHGARARPLGHPSANAGRLRASHPEAADSFRQLVIWYVVIMPALM